jgi:hypothetical protein
VLSLRTWHGTYVTQQLGPQLGLRHVTSLALVRGSVILLRECSTVLVLHRIAGRSVCQSHAQLEEEQRTDRHNYIPLQIQAVYIAVPIYVLLIP